MRTPPKGVLFFDHFPSNYLRPYGAADTRPDHAKVMRRLHPKSCEWLKRPQIAMSEFSQTMEENLALLQTKGGKMLSKKRVNALTTNLAMFMDPLRKLNTKNNEPATPGDVRKLLGAFYEDGGALGGIMEEMFELGGAMYTMAIQYFVANELFQCPDEFADKLVSVDQATTNFKEDRTVRGLKNFLNETCTEQKVAATNTNRHKRNLLRELEESYTPTEESPKKKMKKKNLPAPEQSESSTESSSESSTTISSNTDTESPPPPKVSKTTPKKKNRKKETKKKEKSDSDVAIEVQEETAEICPPPIAKAPKQKKKKNKQTFLETSQSNIDQLKALIDDPDEKIAMTTPTKKSKRKNKIKKTKVT